MDVGKSTTEERGKETPWKAGESMIGKSRVEKLQEFPQNFSALQAKGQLQL